MPESSPVVAAASSPPMPHRKKDVPQPDRILLPGTPDMERCDNKVVSARYKWATFLPVATVEQFRRFANLYFLIVGCIMAVGYYFPDVFESAISPWTTLGPLSVVISFSLLVEGSADYKRHKNDEETNNAPCVIVQRADVMDAQESLPDGPHRDDSIIRGKDVIVNLNKAYYSQPTHSVAYPNAHNNDSIVKVGFQKIRRMDIRQGHFCVVKNREMLPADMVLLASSNDGGSAYIETSSIDGETNLKLRISPRLPKRVLQHLRDGTPLEDIDEAAEDDGLTGEFESIEQATKRITRFSTLGKPQGISALQHPEYKHRMANNNNNTDSRADGLAGNVGTPPPSPKRTTWMSPKAILQSGIDAVKRTSHAEHAETAAAAAAGTTTTTTNHQGAAEEKEYVAALTTEPPNPSVHTFNGKLTLPPFDGSNCYDIPLGAENVLLRGAVIRNTEWVIGIAFFTGTDTKLIQNSFATPSKFSQLDKLMNFTVLAILCIMILCISYLASSAVLTTQDEFADLWYVGYNKNVNEKWPYLPDSLPAPEWKTNVFNWFQFFFLYVTLLNNFIPLSLYVTVEFITFCMLWFIYSDLDMYDATTNTRAVARSTIVTDLGRVQYIFSDKTGTLTQNVMRFKRCSVDGMVFGAPIQKVRPGAEQEPADEEDAFHPLRQLLVGKLRSPSSEGKADTVNAEGKPTFNAEMFLRVMSLCHTVVVEKDIDNKEEIGATVSVQSNQSGRSSLSRASQAAMGLFHRKRTNTGGSNPLQSPLSVVSEDNAFDEEFGNRSRADTAASYAPGQNPALIKGPDGAPNGYAYQAESPDEGALVSAASSTFGFQVVGRDSSGIKLRTGIPSHLRDKKVTEGLKSGKLSLKRLAAETANVDDAASGTDGSLRNEQSQLETETWQILAVNKFDSDRKRMSILLRSPPELGSLPVLFCKGADSSMLDPEIISNSHMLQPDEGSQSFTEIERPSSVTERQRDVSALTISEDTELTDADNDEEGWEMAQMLGIQAHLGDFASEGLRTLVLGMRILTEVECEDWLEEYKAAAVSLKNRSEMLTAAAVKIECHLHVVGATAIEDKLQKDVPETISTLGKAGIKLWVLTGDKRETAVEIGYSTCVLTPKMHLTEVVDFGKQQVRTQMSMEFIRLTKMGRLPEFQKSVLDGDKPASFKARKEAVQFRLGKCRRSINRVLLRCWAWFLALLGLADRSDDARESLKEKQLAEKNILPIVEKRRRVRACAEHTIQEWLQSQRGQPQRRDQKQHHSPRRSKSDDREDDLSMASEETPLVFNRASSAKSLLKDMKSSGQLSNSEIRKLSIAHLTAQQAGNDEEPLVDEDTLSLDSFFPGGTGTTFDKKKRTILERIFAIDRQVRKGLLKKHLKKESLQAIQEASALSIRSFRFESSEGPRALVIEGSALKHLLGDPDMEQILFAVASNCDAVIACRVSPKQKALLVNLVRLNVRPEPITLAIGDGANDVGMIQEAHVGIGISGKEGKQAVNASDFSIAQFRFLEDLILIHGRWDFFRLSTVVLFSFYKNALMAGCLITYTERAVYSGTPLFDEWLIAMLNFVAGIPIIVLGLFDRCLSKDYVRKNPVVYKATRENELITFRTLCRWIVMVFMHIFSLYFFTVPQQSIGGGITSAFMGLMRNEDDDVPGNGEGGDLKSVGTITFTCLIILLAYKVLYESRSLVHGVWPTIPCSKEAKEGFFSRLAYTWVGVVWGSIFFYLFAISVYQLIGKGGPSQFSAFTLVTNHVLGMRSMSWMLIAFVPLSAMVFDVSGKVFSNMFYPTQTQIHLERESRQKRAAKRRLREDANAQTQASSPRPDGPQTPRRRTPRRQQADSNGGLGSITHV